MNLPSSQKTRAATAGFSLLESMLAVAVLGIVLVGVYTISTRSTRLQIDARNDYEMSSMARAVLDEYVVTYPAMPVSGTYKGTWDWHVTETPVDPLMPTELDQYFEFVRVTALITKTGTETGQVELSTVVARRAQGI